MAKKNSSNLMVFLVLLVVVAVTYLIVKSISCSAGPSGGNKQYFSSMQVKDIVNTAIGAGQFNTLVAAVKAAGLVDTLKGDGPFTVFAPTDAAFAKLPTGTIDLLLKPENKAKLVDILTYHVVPGKVMAADVVKMNNLKTVQGGTIDVTTMGNTVVLNNKTNNSAKIITADIMTSNGVIHVIDNVLIPNT